MPTRFTRQDQADAAWIEADRALQAAELAGQPLEVVASLFRMAHAFMRQQHMEQAAKSAVAVMAPRAENPACPPEELSLLGHKSGAIAALEMKTTSERSLPPLRPAKEPTDYLHDSGRMPSERTFPKPSAEQAALKAERQAQEREAGQRSGSGRTPPFGAGRPGWCRCRTEGRGRAAHASDRTGRRAPDQSYWGGLHNQPTGAPLPRPPALPHALRRPTPPGPRTPPA